MCAIVFCQRFCNLAGDVLANAFAQGAVVVENVGYEGLAVAATSVSRGVHLVPVGNLDRRSNLLSRDVNNQANQAELAIFSRSLAYIG